jgi:hypothetical protein
LAPRFVMEPYWKRYTRHLLLIAIAAIPIALVWKIENKWIAGPVVVIAVLFILLQLSILNKIADEHTDDLHDREEQKDLEAGMARIPPSPLVQKLIYYPVLVLFFAMTTGIVITGKKVENYLEWQPLILDVLKLAWIPVGIAWLYHKKWRIYFDKRDWENNMTIASFVIPLLLVFHGLVWYNYLKPSALVGSTVHTVREKGMNARYGTKYIFLDIDGELKRFEPPNSFYKKIQERDSIRIQVKQGALGYVYIDSFIVVPN